MAFDRVMTIVEPAKTKVPKYMLVSQHLKQAILKGDLCPGDKLPREQDMVKEYGVSRISVRSALKLLSNEGFISTINGVGSFVSKHHAPLKTGTIAFYTSMNGDPRYAPLFRGVSKAARENGFRFEIIHPETGHETSLHDDRLLAELLQSGQIAGLIVDQPLRPKWDDFHFLEHAKIPFLLVGMFKDGKGRCLYHWLRGNWFDQIMSEMIERKCYKISLLLGPLDPPDEVSYSSNQGILATYKRYMKTLAMAYRDEYVLSGDYSIESGYKGGKQLVTLSNPPECIFCGDDYIAVGAIKAVLDHGMNVPKDIKIWGNGNILNPSCLSTVDYDYEQAGKNAINSLMQIMEGAIPEIHPDIGHLIRRASTAETEDDGSIKRWIDDHF